MTAAAVTPMQVSQAADPSDLLVARSATRAKRARLLLTPDAALEELLRFIPPMLAMREPARAQMPTRPKDLAGVLAGGAGGLERLEAAVWGVVAEPPRLIVGCVDVHVHSPACRRSITRRPSWRVGAKSWLVTIVEATVHVRACRQHHRASYEARRSGGAAQLRPNSAPT